MDGDDPLHGEGRKAQRDGDCAERCQMDQRLAFLQQLALSQSIERPLAGNELFIGPVSYTSESAAARYAFIAISAFVR